MMRISALLSMATVAAASSFCSEDDAVYKNGDAAAGQLIVCGSSTSTNCVAEAKGNKDAFCSLVNATKGPFSGQQVAACCTSDDGPAYDVAQISTYKKCLEDNIAGAQAANTWDGENCFNNDGVLYFPTIPTANLQYIYNLVTNGDDCPTDAYKLGFTGTCWRRCGTRGWGVNPNTAYYGGTGGYGGYGYGGYGYGGYGYGGMGGYGYGMYSGFSGAYGGYGGMAYGYGMVPSAFGAPCPDPKMLEMFPDAPAVPMPYYGAGGWGMQPGYGYGGYPGGYGGYGYGGYGYGGYGYGASPYGMGGYGGAYVGSVYGRQGVVGASYMGSVYGGVPSYGMGGAAYVGSVYGRPTTTAYATGSVYGGSAVYGGSVYGGGVYGGASPAETMRPRCDPAMQCSCDTKCCSRGDCCSDLTKSGCPSN